MASRRSLRWLYIGLVVMGLVVGMVSDIFPERVPSSNYSEAEAAAISEESQVNDSDIGPGSDEQGGPANPDEQRASPSECIISVGPGVFHADDPYPQTAIPPVNGSWVQSGYFDVSHPAPQGREEQVEVGDSLVVYLYLINVSEGGTSCGISDTNITVSDILVKKSTEGTIGSMMASMTWPNVDEPGLLNYQDGSNEAFGLFTFEVEPDDGEFEVFVEVIYTCDDPACGLNDFDEQRYPSPDLRTIDGQRYEDYYGRRPVIRVVGPKASVSVVAPELGTIALPYSTVDYIIQLTSLDGGDDVITRITDTDEAEIPKCDEDIFVNPDPDDPDAGWYSDELGTPPKIDTRDLASPLDVGDSLYCRFEVVMDPVIVNGPGNTFTLNGELLAYNTLGQDVVLPVSAPPVVIADASVSVSKLIINPEVPSEGVSVGDEIVYRITVTNDGDTPLTDFTLIDSLIGRISISPTLVLAPGEEYETTANYIVGLGDPTPLLNTVTVQARPDSEEVPFGFVISDSAAASINIISDEITVELMVTEVDGEPFDPDTNAPQAGSVLTYQVEYCNLSADLLRELEYVGGYPRLIDGDRPTYVDASLGASSFDSGCYQTSGTEFTYTVPAIDDPDFTDPVINTIRVRATTTTGQLRYADYTLETNIVSDSIEINAWRYSIDTGAPLGSDTAALRGEDVYYSIEVRNKSNLDLCGVEIRHYVRNSLGNIVPGDPFVIPDSYIEWLSGTPGRLNRDGDPGDSASSIDQDSLRISFRITGDTPDPLYRIFEAYAETDCNSNPILFVDRAAVVTDISDVQVNATVSVFAEEDPDTVLDFGFRQPGLKYKFNYIATNVGITFRIDGLQYCVLNAAGNCALQNFPQGDEFGDFFGPGDDTYLPFETRADQSLTLSTPDGLTGDEPTPLQIQVILTGTENGKTVIVRTLYSFPLLTDELPGAIGSGPSELVRGDGPAPYNYIFTNQTEGRLIDVRVLNLLETGDFVPGEYEPVGVPGFPPDENYEVCQVEDELLDGEQIAGVCNLTYHDGISGGQFQMLVLVVGTRSATGDKVIGLGVWDVTEVQHLTVEKTAPGELFSINDNVTWTITVTNNSLYQPVDFSIDDGFTDQIAPDPPVGSFTPPTLPEFVGLQQVGPIYQLDRASSATATAELVSPPSGYGVEGFTNTATFLGTTAPNPDAPGESISGRQVTGTGTSSVRFACPLVLYGTFLDNPDPYAGTDLLRTVGETYRVELFYVNEGTTDITISVLTDELYVRENGRSLTFNDIMWPVPEQPGFVPTGQAASYQTDLIIRPIDFTEPVDTSIFEWLAHIELAPPAPEGCDVFDIIWFFEMVNPIGIAKDVRTGSPLIFPGDTVYYSVEMMNRSEGAEMFISELDDSVLQTSPLNIEFLRSGAVQPTGRVGEYDAPGPEDNVARLYEDDVQNAYTVQGDDPDSLVNIATVFFYVPQDSGPPEMEKGPSYPMSNTTSAEVATINPLILTLTPSTFEVPAGAQIDIDVQVTNASTEYTIDNIEITTGDNELAEGMAAAGYMPPLLPLGPLSSSDPIEVRDPYYRIPLDFTGSRWEICAQATGRLAELDFELPQVETCIEISILPPELTVEKAIFADATCTNELPDDDLDELYEAIVNEPVWFQYIVDNSSVDQVYSDLTFTDTTNVGDDLTIPLQAAFEAANGGSTTMGTETTVTVCLEYAPPQAALAEPVVVNTVTIDALAGDVPVTVEDDVTFEVLDANIAIGKRTDRNVAFTGTDIQYTIVITNRSEEFTLVLDDVWDSLITGQLPGPPSYHDTCLEDGRQFPDFDDCDPTITSVRFDDDGWSWPTPNPGVIPVGEQAFFTYFYEVQPDDPDPLVNLAGVTSHLYDTSVSPWVPVEEEETQELIRPTDQTLAGVAITESQLLVRKDARPSSALVGTRVNYTVSITNVGDVPVSSLQVIDCSPATDPPCDDQLEPFDPGFGGDDLTGLVPENDRNKLDPFDTVSFLLSGVLMPSADALLADPSLDPYINTVYARGQVTVDDSGTLEWIEPGSDTAIVDLVVPGLSVSKSASVGAASIGETVEYTIQVANTGETPIRLDTVTDIVPGDSDWTPIQTMKLNGCDDVQPDYSVGNDLLNAGDFVCAIVNIVVGEPQAGSSEFVNTVRVEATIDPEGETPTTVVDSASTEVDIRDLEVTVVKEAICIVDGEDCLTPEVITEIEDGAEYQYRLTIRNGSSSALSELRIIDAAMGDPQDPDDDDVPVIITDFGDIGPLFDPGETFVYTYNHTASIEFDLGPDAEGNAYTNRATVIGVEDGTGDLTPPRSDTFTIIIKPLDIVAAKVACVGEADVQPDFGSCVTDPTYAQPGDYIWYQVEVSNPAQVGVNNVEVDDTLEGMLDNDAATWDGGVPGTLPACSEPLWQPPDNCPTATFVYRGTDAVSAGVSSVTNTASATAISGSAQVAASDSATVLIASGELLVTITEDSGRTLASSGTELSFTIDVRNLGTDTIQDVTVLLPFINGSTPLATPFDLNGDQLQQFTASYTVTNADNQMDFEVLVDGLVLGSVPVSDTDTWTVVRVTPGVTVEKRADRTIAGVGDQITYTVTVTNTTIPDASIVNLEVSDPFLVFDPPWPSSIPAGESESREYTYTVIGNEGNPIVNEVTVTGSIASSDFVVFDSWEVYVPNGDLLVTSEPSRSTVLVGETVSFTYEICNLSTGESPIDDLTDVELEDAVGQLDLPGTTLEPSVCMTAVRDVTVTADDVPELSWAVTGRGTTSLSEVLTQTIRQTVTVVPTAAGDIRLEARPLSATVSVDDFLDVQFVISNVGDSALRITDFEDATPWWDSFFPDPVGEILQPGDAFVFSGNVLTEGGTGPIPVTVDTSDPIQGTWTVTAEDAESVSFSHSDSISVPIITEGATVAIVDVEADVQTVAVGGTVSYTYTIENLAPLSTTVRLELVDATCTYESGEEPIWQTEGEIIPVGGLAIATATCTVPLDYIETTVDHTLQVFDLAQLPDVQDTITVQTPIEQSLGLEVLEPDPAVWTVNQPATVKYRVFNTSETLTLTNVTSAVIAPTPCPDFDYVDVDGDSVEFDGTLGPQEEVFAQCVYDVENADWPAVEIIVNAEADQVPQPVSDQRTVEVIDLGLTVELTAVPKEQGSDVSVVDIDDTVSFTLTITNTGRTPLELPTRTSQPVSLRVVDADTPSTTIRRAVDPNDLYDYLETLCPDQFDSDDWPMQEDESCTLAFNTAGVEVPDLTFTVAASDPTEMLGMTNITFWAAGGSERPINQQDTWQIRVRRPSLSISSIGITPNPAAVGADVQFAINALNDGLTTVRISRAEVQLFDETPTTYTPQGDVFLMGYQQQAQPFALIELIVTQNVVGEGQPTSATGTWTADRAGTIRAQVNFYGESGEIIAADDLTFTVTTTEGDGDGTDPDGNPLDPTALDPRIEKTVSPESAFPNQQMTFTITITNGSTSAMENVEVVDAVPDAFPVTSATTTQGASIVSGQLVTVTTGTLAPGGRATVTIVVTVGADVTVPSLWVNEACANVTGRDPVCTSVEIAVGALGPGEGVLPTTGYDGPLSQGYPGAAGILSLFALGGFVMLSTTQSNRQRLIIGGVVVGVIVAIGVGVLLLAGDDESDDLPDEGETEVAQATSSPTMHFSPTPTLARRPTSTPRPTLNATEETILSTVLPVPPTLIPSPTPYLLPTAAGPRRLSIPRLDFTRPIPIVELPFEGNSWDVSTLGHNVGWLHKTTWLEPDWGNTVLVGHVQLTREDPGPFYRLRELELGDEIIILEGEVEFRYLVTDMFSVPASDITITHPTLDPVLTLLTCTNWDADNGVFADRYIVRAEPIG